MLAGSACAPRPPSSLGTAEPRAGRTVTVYVTNHLGQVEVFAAAGPAHTYRMGYVDAGTRKQFVLSLDGVGGGVEFVARVRRASTGASSQTAAPCACGTSARQRSPEASAFPTYDEVRSGYLMLTPGDIVDWVVSERSTASVRPR